MGGELRSTEVLRQALADVCVLGSLTCAGFQGLHGAVGVQFKLWSVVTNVVTVFMVRRSRGAQVAHELLGAECSGILVPDRYSAYN